MNKILITGFNPFAGAAVNPSQLIVEQLVRRPRDRGGWTLTGETLPTEFGGAERRMRELIQTQRPDAVLSIGLAGSAEGIRLERVALNVDDAIIPDNAGDQARGRLIVPDGPAAYWSTLPIQEMLAALQARGIPAVISNHAGTFVCNHVMYVARDEIERLGLAARSGFIHVPPLARPEDSAGKPQGLTLEIMTEAIEICLEAIRQSELSLGSAR